MKGTVRLLLSSCIILHLILLCWNLHAVRASEEEESATTTTADNVVTKVFTAEELKKFDGSSGGGADDDGLIYLAIFGRVYDVSKGRDYYGPEAGYSIFAGRDAPVPFVTGTFTEEEAAKPWDEVPTNQHGALLSWRDFYENEDKYPFVGVVEGPFYDKNGQPLPELARVEEALAEAKKAQEAREAERQRKLAERARKKEEEAKRKEAAEKQKMTEL